jgi:hypothetical protein
VRLRSFIAVHVAALATALAVMALAPAVAPATEHHGDRLPDAEIFATNSTTLVTDPDDPRLDDRLVPFKHQVKRMIRCGGGQPGRSTLLDGAFFSSILNLTTFQRSREFDVDAVSSAELHAIADRVRLRFQQQSVLTFDYPDRPGEPIDAVELEVPGVSARALADGFLADRVAREHLMGGSVTLDGRLFLIAALPDAGLAMRFVTEIGGDLRDATVRLGRREFVGA